MPRAKSSRNALQCIDLAHVTLALEDFLARDGNVPVHSNTVTIQMKRLSDIAMLARTLGGLLGGAVGAARTASAGGNPGIGAGAVGSRQAGRWPEENFLIFEITRAIDLSGVAW